VSLLGAFSKVAQDMLLQIFSSIGHLVLPSFFIHVALSQFW
jgi:hypothetical protein